MSIHLLEASRRRQSFKNMIKPLSLLIQNEPTCKGVIRASFVENLNDTKINVFFSVFLYEQKSLVCGWKKVE